MISTENLLGGKELNLNNWTRLRKKILLKILQKKKVSKLSHLEQMEKLHERVRSLVFQDLQFPHQLGSDINKNPKTKRCHCLR